MQTDNSFNKDFADNLNSILSGKLPAREKLNELGLLFTFILENLTDNELINFTTLFSRIVYLQNHSNYKRKKIYILHVFRKIIENSESRFDLAEQLSIAQEAIQILLIQDDKANYVIDADIDKLVFSEPNSSHSFQSNESGIILDEADGLIFISDNKPDKQWKIELEDTHQLNQLRRILEFEDNFIHVNLMNVKFDLETELVKPKLVIVLPNYLMDVTSIAECFKSDGQVPEQFILRKFIRIQKKVPLVLGNAANQFLDALVYDSKLDMKELMLQVFRSDPLAFLSFDEKEMADFFSKAALHFKNIKSVLSHQLKAVGIDVDNTYTEPSFLSNLYGLQGRLDLLHQTDQNRVNNIIELKSGSVYKPNTYNIANNHYTQTLLYDLMVNSSFGKGTTVSNYILYSKLETESLRFAPKATNQQVLALRLRNDLVFIDLLLQNLDKDHFYKKFVHILESRGRGVDRFVSERLFQFGSLFENLTELEQLYFRSFAAFNAREHSISKIGTHGISRSNGLATLWMDTIAEKIEQFSILYHLSIKENKTFESDPTLTLSRTPESNKLAKFRVGDIVVLYPFTNAQDSPLRNQIFKCTILELSDQDVKLKLRDKQFNQTIFNAYQYWNVEPDLLDSSYLQMYRNLTHWMGMNRKTRSLLLGTQQPRPAQKMNYHFDASQLTDEQTSVMKKMIDANDLFLLWGPPGTGKTSVMIRELVRHFSTSNSPVLLLAYTNRAVDEICDAILALGESYRSAYVRVGSNHSCHDSHKPRLFNNLVKTCNSRQELKNLLDVNQIYVSTISSLLGKLELFKLKSFDTIIIDEASQVLEPMILGLMGYTDKVILIGDHKQLPAVVQQSEFQCKVKFPILKDEIKLQTLNRSLFERLFGIYVENTWEENFARLSLQGRMHSRIMAFPSNHFYDGKLKVLTEEQNGFTLLNSAFLDFVNKNRVIFIDCEVAETVTRKTNQNEALLVSKLVHFFEKEKQDFSEKYLGVITPFRAQIALIVNQLEKDHIQVPITVDTVERYQGSARNHIIYSMCNTKSNLLSRTQKEDGIEIDRKFNVALTRAKESLIIIGNQSILSRNPIYKAWIEQAVHISQEDLDKFVN